MNDKEQIENVVQLYIDCMDESNPDKVKKVFHENNMKMKPVVFESKAELPRATL